MKLLIMLDTRMQKAVTIINFEETRREGGGGRVRKPKENLIIFE